MEEIHNKPQKRYKPTYKDQITSLNQSYAGTFSRLDENLRDRLHQYCIALEGRYERIQPINERRNKIIRGRSYVKRIEYATEALQEIETLLKSSHPTGAVTEDQISDISKYVQSVYQVAIRDNKYAQRSLTNGGIPQSDKHAFPITVSYYIENSPQVKRLHALGSHVNSLEARLSVNGKRVREHQPRQDSMYRASMSTGVARVPASEAIRPEPEVPKGAVTPLTTRSSPLQKSYADVLNRTLTEMSNSGLNGSQQVLYYTPMRTGSLPNGTATGPYATATSQPSRSWRAEMIRMFSPFHRTHQQATNVYDATSQARQKQGWGRRAIRSSLQLAAGLALLVLPTGSSSTHDVRARALTASAAPMKVAHTMDYAVDPSIQQPIQQLPKEHVVKNDFSGASHLHLEKKEDLHRSLQEMNLQWNGYDQLIREKRILIDLPTEPQSSQYHDAMSPAEATTQAQYSRSRSWKYGV
jgi:hypothetical protein